MAIQVIRDVYGLSGYLSPEADWYPCKHSEHFDLSCKIILFRHINSQQNEDGKTISGEDLLSKIGFIKIGWLGPNNSCHISFPGCWDSTYVCDTTVVQDIWLKQYYHLMSRHQKRAFKQHIRYKERSKIMFSY